MTRRAESDDVRRWNRDVAQANELEEFRAWVIWGLGAPPERAADPERVPPGAPGDQIAERIVAGEDPEWAAADPDRRWVVVVEGDEDDIDAWVQDHSEARGYASHLMEAGAAAAGTELMEGTLRPDVVRRRRFDAGRPH